MDNITHVYYTILYMLHYYALRTVSLEINEIAQKYLIANVEQSTFVAQFSKIISKCLTDEVTSV